jgi:acyl-CoA reductase-like NAD-dependent aldehyde dehydrogenase
MSEVEWIEVRNPRTGQCDFRLCPPSATALDDRIRALRQAQPAWAALPASERAAALERLALSFERHRDAIVGALATDTGRHRLAELEWRAVVATLRGWATDGAELLRSEHGESRALPGVRFQSEGVPYPLVGVISPWNFPLLLALLDAIPALLAGSAVFVKPSEVAPRFVEPVRVAIGEVAELGQVLDLAAGHGALGQAVIDRVDLVCFTGSVRT